MTEPRLIGQMLALRPGGRKLRHILDAAAREGLDAAEVAAGWPEFCAARERREARAAAYCGWQREHNGFIRLPHRGFGSACLRAILVSRRAARENAAKIAEAEARLAGFRAQLAALPAAALWTAAERDRVINETRVSLSVYSIRDGAVRQAMSDAGDAAVRATVAAATKIARRAGWTVYYSSTERATGRRSTRYLKHPSGARLRLSDHELPTTDDRPWSPAAQQRDFLRESGAAPQRAEIIVGWAAMEWDRNRWMAELASIVMAAELDA